MWIRPRRLDQLVHEKLQIFHFGKSSSQKLLEANENTLKLKVRGTEVGFLEMLTLF